jgi:hypothetical protein
MGANENSGLNYPDMSLVRQWSDTVAKSMIYQPPYMATYSLGAKEVFYVAARHRDSDAGLGSPTFSTISEIFEKTPPDISIIEGIPAGEHSPSWLLELARKDNEAGFRTSSEGRYTVWLSHQNGAGFTSGEPTRSETQDSLARQGYSPEDQFLRLAIQCLQQEVCKKTSGINDGNLEAHTDSWLGRRAEGASLSARYLKEWFSQRTGQEMTVESLKNLDQSPSHDNNAGWFRRYMAAEDGIREPATVSAAFQALQQHDRVLIVYGAAHEVKQAPVFRQMFGNKATYSKPF